MVLAIIYEYLSIWVSLFLSSQMDRESETRKQKMIKTFSEPFFRPYSTHVTRADVAAALKAFGPEVKAVVVNPIILNSVTGSVPEDIELKTSPGVGAWEVWGEFPEKQGEKPLVSIIHDIPVPLANNEIVTYRRVKRGRGRPVDPTAVSKTTLWRRAKFPKQNGEALI